MNQGTPVSDEKPRKHRGLVVFYIGMGVVLLLFASGWLASGPLRAWYWEREVRLWMPMQGLTGGENPHVRPVVKLIAVGPPARAAVERLFRENDTALSIYLTVQLRDPKNTWALPALVERVGRRGQFDDFDLLDTVEVISKRNFHEGLGKKTFSTTGIPLTVWGAADKEEARRRILDWWEAEGRAKYGSGQ